jgi:hypothetical protein
LAQADEANDALQALAAPAQTAPPAAAHAAHSVRRDAARRRAGRERVVRLRQALQDELPQVTAVKTGQRRAQARASETDPEARLMKMPDGGYRPAYNWQYATDNRQGVIVGVEVLQAGSDRNATTPMIDQVLQRCGQLPPTWSVDGGFLNFASLEANQARVTLLIPVPAPKDPQRDRYAPLPGDSPVIAAWRARMGTALAQAVYKLRAAKAEWVNALARQVHGVQQVTVRGQLKVRCVALWVALAHNLQIWIRQQRRPIAPSCVARLPWAPEPGAA